MNDHLAPTSPAPVSAGAQRATAREFFTVIFRRRWIILGLFAVTLGTVLVITFSTPLSYISAGQVLIRRGEQKSVMSPVFQVTNEWEIDLGSEVHTAKSWAVLQRAQKILDRERRHLPPVELRERGVEVEVTGKTNVLIIGYSDRDPRLAERACDALLRAYVEYRQSGMLTYPQRFFDSEIGKAGAELDRWMQRRREFSKETGIVDLATQRTSLISLRSNLEVSRVAAAASYQEAKTQYELMGRLQQNPDVDVPSLLQAVPDGTLELTKRSVLEEQGRLTRLRERFRDDAPEVVNAQATLDSLKVILRREVSARFAIARSRVEVARAKLDEVDREIAGVTAKLAQFGNLEPNADEIDNQILAWRTRYSDLTKSSSQALVNENTSPTISVLLLDPASPARPKNAPDYVRVGLAPAFSLVVGVGLAFFVDGLDLTVRTAGHAEEEVRLPVLATLTEQKRRGVRRQRPEPRRDAA